MEDLLEASHGLDDVTKKINDIVAASYDLVPIQRPEVKRAFACLVCRSIVFILHVLYNNLTMYKYFLNSYCFKGILYS